MKDNFLNIVFVFRHLQYVLYAPICAIYVQYFVHYQQRCRKIRLIEDTVKKSPPLKRHLPHRFYFVLGRFRNVVGSESAEIQIVKVLQYLLSNTARLLPPPHPPYRGREAWGVLTEENAAEHILE